MGQLADFFTVAEPTKVASDVQKTRDQGSLSILQSELKKAQGLLPMAKTPQEKLRYESDIAGLTKEIKNFGGQVEMPTQSLASFFTVPTQQEKQLSEEEELAAASKPYFGTPRIAKRPGQPPTPQTGAGETLLSVLSSPGALFGMVGGGLSGAYQEAKAGQFGTPEAANRIEKAMAAGAQRYSYAPRTPEGQEMTADLQRALSGLPPVVPELAGFAPLAAPAMAEAKALPSTVKIEPRQSLRDQLQAQFQAKQQVAPSGFQSGGAAAATTPAMMQANIDAAIAQASPELQAHIAAQPIQKVNLPALETKALEEKHGVNLLTSQRLGDTNGYSDAWNNRSKNGLIGDFEQQPKQLAQAFEQSKVRNAPRISSEADASELGQYQINALAEKDAMRLQNIDNAYKDFRDKYLEFRQAAGLPIENDFPVNGNAFLQNTKKALIEAQAQYDVAQPIQNLLNDIKDKNGKMSFSEFIALDKRLSKAQKEGTGSEKAAAFIVRQQLQNIPLEAEAAALEPMYRNAVALAKERFDVIKSNPAYRKAIGEAADLAEASSQGESLNAAKFHKQFVSNATPESIRRMKAEMPEGHIGHEAITFGELDRAKRAITNANETRVKADTFADFLKNNKSILRESLNPEAMQDVMEIGLLNSKIGKPEAGTFNYSNSYSALIGDLAKQGLLSVAEGKLAAATGGLSGIATPGAKAMLQKFNKDAFAKQQRDPFGGLTKD